MRKLKRPFLFALCLLPVAIAAGIFVGMYQLDTYPDEMLAEIAAQVESTEILIAVGAIQTVVYALFCGFFGHILANKTGLWKRIEFDRKKFFITLAISLIGGILFSLDYWIFGNMIDGVKSAHEASLTVSGALASVLYGGIIEEVMLRLFFLSLVAFIVWKLFCRKHDKQNIPSGVFMVANLISAIAFAAGHLPTTLAIFGELTPLILFRCFLLNGGFALVFGWLYRKYGIIYAMASHTLFHIVCKLIWLIFL